MIFLITTSSLFTACNIVLRSKKKGKAKLEAQKMLSEHGYYLDEKTANKLMRIFLAESNTEALDGAIDNYVELISQFIPGMNVYYAIQNVLYLKGKNSSQKYYDNYSNWNLYDRKLEDGTKPIERLKEIGIEKIDYEIKESTNVNKSNDTNPIINYNNTSNYEKDDVKKLTLNMK